MNIFLPQSVQTQIELEEIADVKRQIITPALSTPIIGIVQDGLLGAYNLTSPNIRINWKDAMNIVSYTSIDDFSAFKKEGEYTGQELFSLIIPSNISTKNAGLDVENGEIKSGQVKKAHLGSKKANSLIHLIWDEYGYEATKTFLDNTQRLVNNFNLLQGFTVGIGDIEIPEQLQKDIYKMFENKKLEVDHLITEIENNPELMDADMFELSLYNDLNALRGNISKMIMENLKADNKFNIMISSGSKGDEVNMGQMGGCLGQQAVEGKRIQKKVNGRSIAYFTQNDDSAVARGFIQNSFLKGTSPTEFIFHNMSSREGLIDTAIKSVTGDTEIVVLENGITKSVRIGDWIDNHIEKNKETVQHFTEREMELLKLDQKTFIPTADEDGKVTWGEVTAVTRHDPGKELYKIKTKGGREVIVTESKSLLIWNKEMNKFLQKPTPDVVIGDCVPVTANLCEPPTVNKYIELKNYISKRESIYGTDFHIARKEVDMAMIGRKKIPVNWWKNNNGNKFELPYEKVSLLNRVWSGRSKIDNILEGYVYSIYNRSDIRLPEQLELNRDNGKFIGLFLAEGNVDIKSGYIQIANNDRQIKDFVIQWFKKYDVKYKESTRINHIGGTSSQVRGFSTLLAKLFTNMLGHGSRNKYIPNEAFSAPKEFIIGLLDGYFSGDGYVTKNNIAVSSASPQLIQGISFLLSRLGIFGTVKQKIMLYNNLDTKNIAPINVLTVGSKYVQLFGEQIKLIHNVKQLKINHLIKKNKKFHKTYQIHNDVVLDSITSIELVDVTKYPKVYDLTVPSTNHFGIANGMICYDTAESGYIQRKLVKLMEDAMVKYDLTVRMANNNIIQFIYGDNGIDSTKQYEHRLNLLKMGNQEVEDKYKFTANEIANYATFTNKQNDDYIDYLLDIRDGIRMAKVKTALNYITMDHTFMLPANLNRIIDNVRNSDLESGDPLEPSYILTRLEELLEYSNTKISAIGKTDSQNPDSLKYRDEMISKSLFKFALHEFLAPKIVIFQLKLNRAKFDRVIDTIINSFNKSVVEPGENVGTIAAQSIGEPDTRVEKWSTASKWISCREIVSLPSLRLPLVVY